MVSDLSIPPHNGLYLASHWVAKAYYLSQPVREGNGKKDCLTTFDKLIIVSNRAPRVSISLTVYGCINAHRHAPPCVQNFVNKSMPGVCSVVQTNGLTAF